MLRRLSRLLISLLFPSVLANLLVQDIFNIVRDYGACEVCGSIFRAIGLSFNTPVQGVERVSYLPSMRYARTPDARQTPTFAYGTPTFVR